MGAVAALLLALTVTHASAQDADRARLEVSGGLRYLGPIRFGNVPANETTPGGGTRALFNSETTLDGSAGAFMGLGVRLSKSLRAEGTFAFHPAQMSTRITSDTEGAANTTAKEPVTQLFVEGGVLAQLGGWRIAHGAPFVTAGVGYLRQLNDGRTLVETGRSMFVGGGLYYVRSSSRPRRVKATGLRADVRAQMLRDGISLDEGLHPAIAISAAVFARF